MNSPKLHIGHRTADIPIIQGGMGVRVSLASLAAAVAEEGGRNRHHFEHQIGGHNTYF